MAPKYKLTYFNITGLGEPIRFILSYGGVEFEDVRIEKEKWPSIKGSTPFGQLPVLEIDGKPLWQSTAICRYLGKQFKIGGDNDYEALMIDIACDTVNDIRLKVASYYYEPNEAAKEEKKGPLMKETLPFFLSKLDSMVKENGGYLAAGKLSWADLYFISVLDYLSHLVGFDLVKDYSNLSALKRTVLEIPNIKKWVSSRPDTI